ncbi:DciA family protein (plasmid) [Streptomyces sp. NBC_01351]|uniref:DciA family protein n=1 Tax=Streptomyces sp. NBC_01351 TaxID=2903833 RepID=UPI002E360190|nr:DciA family protein [Streptomyces sp. NBC_01351]
MSQPPQPSGVDLARVALRAAREAAKKNGARTAKSKPRLTREVRRDGRAPMGLGEAFTALMAERDWEIPAAGAGLCERWAALAPDLAGHIAAVGYDAERGELTLRPDSTAWATKARLQTSRIIANANQSARTEAVRMVRVLPPGLLPSPSAAAEPDLVRTSAPQGTVRTRETASAGYRRALEAHQQVHTQRQADPAIAAAVERQNRVLREANPRAFPDPESNPDGGPDTIEDARAERRRQAAATEAAARRRARAEKAGLTSLFVATEPRRLDLTG